MGVIHPLPCFVYFDMVLTFFLGVGKMASLGYPISGGSLMRGMQLIWQKAQ